MGLHFQLTEEPWWAMPPKTKSDIHKTTHFNIIYYD